MKKKIAFFIDSLEGGGAERVVSVLSGEFIERGYAVDILMIKKRPIAYDLPKKVGLYYAEDMPVLSSYGKLVRKSFEIWNKFRGRVYIPALRRMGKWDYPKANETSFYFYAKYAMPYREYLRKNERCTTLGFLIRSNISMLQAAKGLNVRTVFCERNNPVRPDMPKNIIKIRDHIYTNCTAAVFQTDEEQLYYKKLKCPCKVIPNPIKDGLPEPYEGERRHEIVNFCRLNKQKNIPLLIDAFEILLKDYPDYTLRIYGRGSEKENIENYIVDKNLKEKIFLEDFAEDVHDQIKDAAMFAFTSDYEGLSNSMIEAMAIGLPCVCTDCAGGGARMMIKDHINGILVPVGDVRAVYNGMKEILDNPKLSQKLSFNARKVREQLTTEKIIKQWENMI